MKAHIHPSHPVAIEQGRTVSALPKAVPGIDLGFVAELKFDEFVGVRRLRNELLTLSELRAHIRFYRRVPQVETR